MGLQQGEFSETRKDKEEEIPLGKNQQLPPKQSHLGSKRRKH